MAQNEIQRLEKLLFDTYKELVQRRRDNVPVEVDNYKFQTLDGTVTLLDLFGSKDTLFLIHNMGQGCRYCTLWADGINGFLPHIEDRFAVALVSKDDPETQRRFASDRGWRFRMASHSGSNYVKEQTTATDHMGSAGTNHPGLVCYIRKGNQIFRKNASLFGPGDEFCGIWNLLSLAGFDEDSWTPQFHYWKRPEKLDDGGQNLKG